MTPSTNASSSGGRASSVEFRDVTKRYASGGSPAVNGITLHVPAGSTCVLVGPSGCGKTTTLRMVNRLVEPTSGQILLDGTDVMAQDPVTLRRRIGYVIQQVGLFPHLTVGQNVAVVPALLGWEKRRREARVEELLALVGLEPTMYARRYPHQLSGGERQRVGVARALGADPPLLLMDEPFGAVDPIARARLQDELLDLQGRIAKTVLFVTHDVDEAIKLGDLVAVFQTGGTIAQVGSPDEILARPASEFVARFVGEDRGLKRLALTTVGEVEVEVDSAAISPDNGIPRLPATMTLRDALSTLLAANADVGLALDGEDRPRGRLSVDSIASAVRTEPAAIP